MGVMHAQGADQGLLVAWGGLSKPVRETVERERFRVRAWTAEDVVDAVLDVYDDLAADIRTELPLQRLWVLAE